MIDKNNENENLIQQDLLNRKKYSNFLTDYIVNQDEPFVININSPWGTGKTFFLKQWLKDVENNHLAVYFNAWEHDYHKEPVPAIVTSIYKVLQDQKGDSDLKDNLISKSSKFLKAAAPTVVKGLISRAISQEATEGLIQMTKEDEKIASGLSVDITKLLISVEDNEKNSIREYGKAITDLIDAVTNEENCILKPPLFVFIDELDRCRPTFSIELLESIKHLFGIKGVVFVVATDTNQLSHSVKAIYGEGFNGELYLRRFFDQIYTLPEPNYFDFSMMLLKGFDSIDKLSDSYNISKCIKNRGSNDISDKFTINTDSSKFNCQPNRTIYPINVQLGLVFTLFAEFFALDLRTFSQCFNKFCVIANTTHENNKVHYAYLIFLIMLEAKSPSEFSNFFKEIDFNKKTSALELTSDSKCNILTHNNNKVTAIDFVTAYTSVLDNSEYDIRRKINNLNKEYSFESSYEWLKSILDNYKDLHEYKNKVLMASHFSE